MSYTDLFSFYRSDEWSRFRKVFLSERMERDGELVCEHCGKAIVHPYEAILHHKIELTEENVFDADVALNPDNIMLVCPKSHNAIHERWGYVSRVKKVNIVWGSPCAGKRAFVEESAGPKDLIVDIDRLYEAMTTNEDRGATKGNVLSIYRTLIDMVKTRNGRWRTAWIVRTLPLSIDRENIVREVNGGEMIHIDTSMEECLEEAKRRGGEWETWVQQYWSRYQPPEME